MRLRTSWIEKACFDPDVSELPNELDNPVSTVRAAEKCFVDALPPIVGLEFVIDPLANDKVGFFLYNLSRIDT